MIKRYKLYNIRTWESTNCAIPLDCIDGTLVDNAIYRCKHGFAIIAEMPVTAWTSGYKMLFARESNLDDVTTLWRIWDGMKQNALA